MIRTGPCEQFYQSLSIASIAKLRQKVALVVNPAADSQYVFKWYIIISTEASTARCKCYLLDSPKAREPATVEEVHKSTFVNLKVGRRLRSLPRTTVVVEEIELQDSIIVGILSQSFQDQGHR